MAASEETVDAGKNLKRVDLMFLPEDSLKSVENDKKPGIGRLIGLQVKRYAEHLRTLADFPDPDR